MCVCVIGSSEVKCRGSRVNGRMGRCNLYSCSKYRLYSNINMTDGMANAQIKCMVMSPSRASQMQCKPKLNTFIHCPCLCNDNFST